jgi:hypothetical protein
VPDGSVNWKTAPRSTSALAHMRSFGLAIAPDRDAPMEHPYPEENLREREEPAQRVTSGPEWDRCKRNLLAGGEGRPISYCCALMEQIQGLDDRVQRSRLDLGDEAAKIAEFKRVPIGKPHPAGPNVVYFPAR